MKQIITMRNRGGEDDGWPRTPPLQQAPPAIGLTTTFTANNGGDVSEAAAEDNDDGEEDKTHAATIAVIIQAQGSCLRARKRGGDKKSSPHAQKRGGCRHPPSRKQGRGGATNRRYPRTTRSTLTAALGMHRHYTVANTPSLRRCVRYYEGSTVGGGAGAHTE